MNIRIERRPGHHGDLRAVVLIDGAAEMGYDNRFKQWYFITTNPREMHRFPKLKVALAAWRLMK